MVRRQRPVWRGEREGAASGRLEHNTNMCKCIYGHQRARANNNACLVACLAACHAAGDEAKGCGLFAAVDLVTHLQIAKIYTRSLQTHAYAYKTKHTKGRSECKGGGQGDCCSY